MVSLQRKVVCSTKEKPCTLLTIEACSPTNHVYHCLLFQRLESKSMAQFSNNFTTKHLKTVPVKYLVKRI